MSTFTSIIKRAKDGDEAAFAEIIVIMPLI